MTLFSHNLSLYHFFISCITLCHYCPFAEFQKSLQSGFSVPLFPPLSFSLPPSPPPSSLLTTHIILRRKQSLLWASGTVQLKLRLKTKDFCDSKHKNISTFHDVGEINMDSSNIKCFLEHWCHSEVTDVIYIQAQHSKVGNLLCRDTEITSMKFITIASVPPECFN